MPTFTIKVMACVGAMAGDRSMDRLAYGRAGTIERVCPTLWVVRVLVVIVASVVVEHVAVTEDLAVVGLWDWAQVCVLCVST